jgi:hypothetical protein
MEIGGLCSLTTDADSRILCYKAAISDPTVFRKQKATDRESETSYAEQEVGQLCGHSSVNHR